MVQEAEAELGSAKSGKNVHVAKNKKVEKEWVWAKCIVFGSEDEAKENRGGGNG